jgi:hypothetical protein
MPKIILALAPILLMTAHSAQAETAPWWVGDATALQVCREAHVAPGQAPAASCPTAVADRPLHRPAPVVSIAVSEAPASVSEATDGLVQRHAELDYALAEGVLGPGMETDVETGGPEEETRSLVVAEEGSESTDLGPPDPNDPRLHPDEDVRGRGPIRFCRLETCTPNVEN